MKYYKAFLASSINEFRHERREIGDFIRVLNNVSMRHGAYIYLTICENVSNSLAQKQKQSEYDQMIRDSRFCYFLFGRHAGAYTRWELQVAQTQFQASGAPKIRVYFAPLPEGETADEDAQALQQQLREAGVDCRTFAHLDCIKLDILLDLAENPEIRDVLRTDHDTVSLFGQRVLSLENARRHCGEEGLRKRFQQRGWEGLFDSAPLPMEACDGSPSPSAEELGGPV